MSFLNFNLLNFLQIQEQDTMNMSSTLNVILLQNYFWIYSYGDLTSHLKFCSETVVFYSQFTHLVMNHSLDEGLDTELEIAGSQ